MLTGLNATDLAVAKRGTSMNNLQLGPGKDGVFPTTKIDLKVSNLSATQKAVVLAAIKNYSDGWPATRKAWKGLFKEIVLVLCFLHSYIKIRSISKKEPLKNEIFNQVWDAHKAVN